MMAIPIILVVAALIMWRRLSATRKPIKGNGMRILLPILFIWIGITSLFQPRMHTHLSTVEVCVSLLLGVVLSVPLIVTTNYEVRADGFIYAKKSAAFVVCLLVILAIRLALRNLLSGYDSSTMMAMYCLVAFGYVVPWRVASFIKFRRVNRTVHAQRNGAAVTQ